jgi:L-ascorbate metabolism protein UlaG (beta-lactamase superfamily)
MRITKFGHACVRIEHEGGSLVIDPGNQTGLDALDGALAVLLTHEHADHCDPERLRASNAPIFTIAAVAQHLSATAPDLAERITVVAPGEEFGEHFAIRAVGELHAVIHPEYPRLSNSGYIVAAGGRAVFHPGDALTMPGEPVDVLCVPVSAPWLKATEAIEFARAVGAPRNLAIHDRVYSEFGLGIMDGHFAKFLSPTGQDYARLADGSDF